MYTTTTIGNDFWVPFEAERRSKTRMANFFIENLKKTKVWGGNLRLKAELLEKSRYEEKG